MRHSSHRKKKNLEVSNKKSYDKSSTKIATVEERPQPIIKKTIAKTILGKKKKSSLLDNIEAEVTQKTTTPETPKVELSQATLQTYWQKYSDEKVTSNRTKNVFKNSVLSLNGSQVRVEVSSNFNKGALTEERNLIFFLREKLNVPDLSIQIFVNKTNIPEPVKPKRPQILSPREKYRLMRKVNPMVDELQKRFGLFPEQ